MNRYLIFIASMFLFVVCTVLLTRNLKPGPSPADILPADTLGTFEVIDLSVKLEALKASPIGLEVIGPDFPYILLQMGMSLSQVASFDNLKEVVIPLTEKPAFKTLFSGKTAFALLSPGKEGETTPGIEQVVLVTQFPVQLDLDDVLPVFAKGGKGTASTSSYQGISMVHINLSDDITITAALHQGLLISGFTATPVKRCLDESLSRIVQPVTGLWLNWRYSRFRQQAADSSDLFFYAKVTDILSTLSGNPSVRDGFPDHWGIPEYIFASSWQEETVSRLKVRTLFSDKVLTGFQNRYGLSSSFESEDFLSLPWDTQLYFRTSWFNMTAMWQAALRRTSLPEAAVFLLLAQRVYEYTGLSINELLEMFGPQLAIYINDFGGGALFPVPKISFSLEVREQENLAVVLNRLLEDLPKQQFEAGGVPYVALQLGRGLMQPSYAFVEKAVLFADAREQLVRLLTASNDSLYGQKDYMAVDVGFDQPSIFEGFLRTRMLNKALYGFLAWLEKTCHVSTDYSAQRTGLMVRHLFRPLLKSLDSILANGMRGYLQGNSFIIEAAFYATDKPAPVFAQPQGIK